MIIDEIKKIIDCIAKSENDILLCNQKKGIFDLMDEHAFVYQVGKQIGIHSHAIFGFNISWGKEEKLEGNTQSDLIIKYDSEVGRKIMVFEFKMSGKFEDKKHNIKGYKDDILKLQNFPSSIYKKYFCALIDVRESDMENDGRILCLKKIEEKNEIKRIGELYFFKSTNEKRYKGEIYCCIGLWEII